MNYKRRVVLRSIRTDDPNRVAEANRRLKRAYWADGIRSCEFCGWDAPPGLFGIAVCLRIHHIIPLFTGGALEDRLNTTLLCATDAAISDAIAFKSMDGHGNYRGPKNREELFKKLRELEAGRGKPFVLRTAPVAMEGFRAE